MPNDGITMVISAQPFNFNVEMLKGKRMMLLHLIYNLLKAGEISCEKAHQALTISTEDAGLVPGVRAGFGPGPGMGPRHPAVSLQPRL